MMEVLTIGAAGDTADPLRTELEKHNVQFHQYDQGTLTFFHCEQSETPFPQMLARLIVHRLQSHWLGRLLRREYGYFDAEEQAHILNQAQMMLHATSKDHVQRADQLLTEYLPFHEEMILEGFVRFRLKEYWRSLQESLNTAVDDYLMDCEYQEFIKLLRYFVELQEPKLDLVHVVMVGSEEFELLDEEGTKIEMEYLEGCILEIGHEELDLEDLLISSLITAAPQQIMVHLHNGRSVAETIASIFEDRVSFCGGCRLCERSINTQRKGK